MTTGRTEKNRGVAVWTGTRLVIGRTAPAPSRGLVALAGAVGVLAAITAAVGLLWTGSGEAYLFQTLRGETVEIFGRGLYAHNTAFQVGANWGVDLVALALGIPLLAVAAHLYRRSSLRGHLLLIGSFGFFLYYGASYALGTVAYNQLFLVYTALFSASLFGLILALVRLEPGLLAPDASMPRRIIGWFMIVSGVVTAVIWLLDPVAALVAGETPSALGNQTTLFTHALDLGVIVPTAVLSGVMILRGRLFGYAAAMSLLVLEVALLPMIAIATYAQIRLGVSFTTAEILGPIGGFSVVALGAVGAIVAVLRHMPNRTGATLHFPSN